MRALGCGRSQSGVQTVGHGPGETPLCAELLSGRGAVGWVGCGLRGGLTGHGYGVDRVVTGRWCVVSTSKWARFLSVYTAIVAFMCVLHRVSCSLRRVHVGVQGTAVTSFM